MDHEMSEVFGTVIANEATCRLFLKGIEAQGVQFSMPIEKLNHEECIEIAIGILKDTLREEKLRELK